MKRILLVADKPGWIFERHCWEIQRRIAEYRIDVGYLCDPGIERQCADYDLVYMLDPFLIELPDYSRVILGVRAEWLYLNYPGGARRFYRERIHRRCAIVHVVNRRQLKVLESLVRKKPLLLVQHGVDETCFNPIPRQPYGNDPGFVVGSVGNPNSPCAKGLDIVAEACRRVGVRHVTAKQDFSNGHRVKEQMPAFYAALDVHCVMSANEGLNNTILEAGAMGIPVVTTRAGAAPEIIRDGVNGILVDRSREALERALIVLRSDPDLRRRMGQRLRETILANWTWATRIKDFRNMFDRFFANAAGTRCGGLRRWW